MRQMKTILILAVSLLCVTGMSAQQSGGDHFEGLSRKIGFSRMIPPHGLEVTYEKTVHIIFPAPVKYVDLGNTNLVAGKADGAENVLRVKGLFQLQREVRGRTPAAQHRDVRLHP